MSALCPDITFLSRFVALFTVIWVSCFCAVSAGLPKVTWVETIAGSPVGTTTEGFADGRGSNTRFSQPTGVAVDPDTGILYISERSNCAIRAMDVNFNVTTIAGSPSSLGASCNFLDASVGTNARFDYSYDLVVHGALLHVADTNNHRIRAVDLSSGTTLEDVGGSHESFS